MSRLWISVVVSLLAVSPAFAKPPPAAASAEVVPAKAKGFVFLVMTGPEDTMRAMQALRMARVALESGSVEASTVVLAGRAAVYLLPGTKMPAEIDKELAAAKAAGVRVTVCEHSLGRWGIPVEHAATVVEVVPKAVVELARLSAMGHEILNF